MRFNRFLLASALALSSGACMTGNIGGQDEAPESAAAPARVRRLTRDEYDNSVSAVLGSPQTVGQGFAAEDSILGFFTHERLQVTSLLADQLDTAAINLSDVGVTQLKNLLTCPGQTPEACARAFIRKVGARAFRRPVTTEEENDLLALYNAGAAGATATEGAKLVLQGIFSSASFVYRTELGSERGRPGQLVELTPYEVASALSYAITAGPPDDALLAAADSGALSSPDERERQARRLLATPAARHQLHEFVLEWLGLTGISKINKNNQVYPDFSVEFRESAQAETDAFIDDVLSRTGGSVTDLLGASYSVADERMASFYGVSAPTTLDDSGIGRITLPAERAGILTQASVMATYAHFDSSSPIKRGKFILTRLLCRTVSPPPPSVVIIPPSPRPDTTTRDRFAAHTNNPACSGCHKVIDPIGFGMEDFDGLGAHRTEENGFTVDASGGLDAPDGTRFSFSGGAQLARYLSTSNEVADCAPLQLFRYAMGRDERPSDADALSAMRGGAFRSERLKLTEALVSLVRAPSFTQRRVPSR
ncbi:hypothetical protein DRW03_25845 [Corallococcus sp. H22C18031201]|uniref:DUF1592 domain-containing protein n=1 Tax=Citreicoccus inhibens TaxID=2849499 RepID=UPI000E72D9A5|nr:DUF1592 domain-containing protein [Citreicoccus inhibens]MBU8898098.1 DUF1592 domain-containing protein [Citreicoccus inhibens]RJS17986.1 hypothetical protein DRW03_25845 [Corallococcus sp. H22C18031201]